MMQHEHSHFELHKALHDKMSKLYIFQAMFSFARSLIGIFVPVYLFKIGYSIIEIILYNIGFSILFLILIPLSIKVIRQIGFKYTIVYSTLFYLFHIIILNYVDGSYFFFHLSWISYAFFASLFWPTFHNEIAVSGSNKHRSSQMGTLQIISTIFGTAAPLIGGIFLEVSSYWNLLIFASIILALGLIPLLNAKDLKLKHYNFEIKDYVRLFKDKKNLKAKKSFAYEGANQSLIIIVWPILVFIFLKKSFINLGILITIVSFINLVFILYIKSYFDKKNKHYMLKKITKINSLSWFFKSIILLLSAVFLYIIEWFSKLIRSVFDMLYLSIFYNNAKKKGYMEYIILREFYHHSSKILFAFFMIVVLFIFGETLFALSVLAFTGVFTSLGISHLKEEI